MFTSIISMSDIAPNTWKVLNKYLIDSFEVRIQEKMREQVEDLAVKNCFNVLLKHRHRNSRAEGRLKRLESMKFQDGINSLSNSTFLY